METYDNILGRLRQEFFDRTGLIADDASDIGIRFMVIAGEIFAAYAELEWLRNQMFPTTATGEYLDLHAEQRGLIRTGGAKASGEVVLGVSYPLNYDLVVPEGTIVSTGGTDPVRFRTTETATIPAGQMNGTADIEALEYGAEGNVRSNEICVLVTPVAGVAEVSNGLPTSGGINAESDDHLRKRIIDSWKNISNGTNEAYYKRLALSVNGVTEVGVIPKRRGPGTLDVYVSGAYGATPPELLDAVRVKLEREREINVDIEVYELTYIPVDIALTLKVKDGYDFAEVRAACAEAIEHYFSLLGGGESVYLSDIGEQIAHIDGVENYSFVHALTRDTEISPDHAARCGELTITERV